MGGVVGPVPEGLQRFGSARSIRRCYRRSVDDQEGDRALPEARPKTSTPFRSREGAQMRRRGVGPVPSARRSREVEASGGSALTTLIARAPPGRLSDGAWAPHARRPGAAQALPATRALQGERCLGSEVGRDAGCRIVRTWPQERTQRAPGSSSGRRLPTGIAAGNGVSGGMGVGAHGVAGIHRVTQSHGPPEVMRPLAAMVPWVPGGHWSAGPRAYAAILHCPGRHHRRPAECRSSSVVGRTKTSYTGFSSWRAGKTCAV